MFKPTPAQIELLAELQTAKMPQAGHEEFLREMFPDRAQREDGPRAARAWRDEG